MKNILISIKPKYVSMILNGDKTIEVRKRFPVDYVGWVYIYCTKGQGLVFDNQGKGLVNSKLFPYAKNCPEHNRLINGKVVARFWCDKVEKIRSYLEPEQWYMTSDLGGSGLLQKSCLTFEELDDYLLSGYGYAIHITKLEIFDKPKEISEFRQYTGFNFNCSQVCSKYKKYGTRCLEPYNYCPYLGKKLTRAPQSWQFIEV